MSVSEPEITRRISAVAACCSRGLGPLAIARLELPQRLRQALLQVADLGAVVFGGLAGERSLGICLPLCRLCPATHQPLLASYSPAIDERLGEGSRVSKANGWVRTVPGSAREPLVIPAAAFTAGSGAIRSPDPPGAAATTGPSARVPSRS